MAEVATTMNVAATVIVTVEGDEEKPESLKGMTIAVRSGCHCVIVYCQCALCCVTSVHTLPSNLQLYGMLPTMKRAEVVALIKKDVGSDFVDNFM